MGPDSWYMVYLFKLDHSFLTEAVESWSTNVAYQECCTKLQAVNVVNDCAEWGVKLSSDFLAASKDEEHYQDVLQVVEQDRKDKPNLRKRKSDPSTSHQK